MGEKTVASIVDVRINGRGGQGAVTASRLLAEAAILEGQYVHAFPNFGPERAGAPVTSFSRICSEPFTEKTEVYNPDIEVVIDSSLLGEVQIAEGLKRGGTIICNYEGKIESLKHYFEVVDSKIYKISGTRIAREELGINKPNMVMLGALLKVAPVVKLESLIKVTKERFKGVIGEKNAKAMKRAYNEVTGDGTV